MILFFFRLIFLVAFNFGIFYTSPFLNTDQLIKDINIIFHIDMNSLVISYWVISFSVSVVTLILVIIFKPFIEIYLLHYSRYLFYLLVSLLSLSSIYIVFRIYGYSRFSLVIYVLISSIFLHLSEKLSNRINY
jgi:hypothetical protein